MKKFLVKVETHEVILINDNIEVIETGFKSGFTCYDGQGLELREVETIPQEVEPYNYCYSDGDFYLNPRYLEDLENQDKDKQIKRLESLLDDALSLLVEMEVL